MISFLRPNHIAQLMDCSISSAYSVIHNLNQELKAKGAYIRSGRVSTKYFCERFRIDPETLEEGIQHEKAHTTDNENSKGTCLKSSRQREGA